MQGDILGLSPMQAVWHAYTATGYRAWHIAAKDRKADKEGGQARGGSQAQAGPSGAGADGEEHIQAGGGRGRGRGRGTGAVRGRGRGRRQAGEGEEDEEEGAHSGDEEDEEGEDGAEDESDSSDEEEEDAPAPAAAGPPKGHEVDPFSTLRHAGDKYVRLVSRLAHEFMTGGDWRGPPSSLPMQSRGARGGVPAGRPGATQPAATAAATPSHHHAAPAAQGIAGAAAAATGAGAGATAAAAPTQAGQGAAAAEQEEAPLSIPSLMDLAAETLVKVRVEQELWVQRTLACNLLWLQCELKQGEEQDA